MSYAGTVLSTSPTFYFRFEETSGDILDEVSQAYFGGQVGWDLTVTGPDGLGSAVAPNTGGPRNVTTWPEASTTFSCEMWVKPRADPPYQQNYIIAEAYNEQGFRFGRRGGKARFWFNESGGTGFLETNLTVDVWHYVVATFDGTNGRLYVDGTLIDTGAMGLVRTGDLTTTIFGGSGWNADDPADEVAFHDGYVLTDAEVSARYDAALPATADTVTVGVHNVTLTHHPLTASPTGTATATHTVHNLALTHHPVSATATGTVTVNPGEHTLTLTHHPMTIGVGPSVITVGSHALTLTRQAGTVEATGAASVTSTSHALTLTHQPLTVSPGTATVTTASHSLTLTHGGLTVVNQTALVVRPDVHTIVLTHYAPVLSVLGEATATVGTHPLLLTHQALAVFLDGAEFSHWTGTGWHTSNLRRWNGTEWVLTNPKRWDGALWQPVS